MRDYTEEERREYAEMSPPQALPDGSYPMPDCDAVSDAIEAFGRAPESHRKDLAALIERRNEDLECGHELAGIREEASGEHEHGPEHGHEEEHGEHE